LVVGKKQLLEWSQPIDGWRPLSENERIEDRCLVRPLPARALLNAAASDEAVVGALRARQVPAMVAVLADERRQGEAKGRAEGRAEGLAEGEAKGLRQAAMALCEVLSIDVSPARRARLEAMGADELGVLCQALREKRRWPRGGER
jgi:hypothetical protein